MGSIPQTLRARCWALRGPSFSSVFSMARTKHSRPGETFECLRVREPSIWSWDLVFANYGAVFRDVNGMFNSVANFIYNSTGVGDLFANWMNQLAQYWQANGSTSLWNLVTGLASGVISLMLILSAFVIFPVCYLIFTVFYAMYGSVLYVTGPFVLALLPTRGLGQLSRTYLVNLMIFQSWGLVYAIIQVLMSAVNLSSINAVLGANGVLNSFVGSSEMILLALTASIFSFSIALIPFIASRIVRGDVGSTMMTMVSTMTATLVPLLVWPLHRSLASEKVQPPLMQRVEEHLRPHPRHPVGQEVRCQERHLRHFPPARACFE